MQHNYVSLYYIYANYVCLHMYNEFLLHAKKTSHHSMGRFLLKPATLAHDTWSCSLLRSSQGSYFDDSEIRFAVPFCTFASLTKKSRLLSQSAFYKTGNVLFSQAASHQVSSALESLTSVFEMGTGGSSPPLSPDLFFIHFTLNLREKPYLPQLLIIFD